jgi:hypothetical protein
MGGVSQTSQRVNFPSRKAYAKAGQGYNSNPVHPTCQNCKHFRFETEIRRNLDRSERLHPINLRCNLGGFAVIRTAACVKHETK